MVNESTGSRENGKKDKREKRRKRQMQERISFLIRALILLILALHIKDIHAQLKQMQVVLKRIEDPQYELTESGLETLQEADYVSSIGIVNVERPMQRTWTETLQRLDSLGKTNPAIGDICKDSSRYPESMLTALANNPEMADYVAGYPDRDENVSGGLTESEKRQEYPLFLQWDPRWGYQSYGSNGYIGVSGCGPTCLSMALYYLVGDESLTPDRIAAYALRNGYYVEGTGTAWALIKEFPRIYDVEVGEPEISEKAFRAELDRGNVLICAMDKGDFTAAGHFIVIYGYDEDGLRVNDPNCVARSRKRWGYDEIKGQIKKVWALGR